VRTVDWNKDPASFTEDELRILDSENPGLSKAARGLQQTLSDQGFEELEQHQAEQMEEAREHAVANQGKLVNEYERLKARYELVGYDSSLMSEKDSDRLWELEIQMGVYALEDDADEKTLSEHLDYLYANLDAVAPELDDNHPIVLGLRQAAVRVYETLYPA